MKKTRQSRGATAGALAGLVHAAAAVGQVPTEPLAPYGGGGPADGPGLNVDWQTIDGGGATYLTGGVFALGATAGQPDAGRMSGGVFELGGGFWFGVDSAALCYANCDGSVSAPVLTPNDFLCFLNSYAANSSYANCDGSTSAPVLTPNDFLCFLNAYASGCS